MVEANKLINPATGRQWDLDSLIERLFALQDLLNNAQEKNVTYLAQLKDFQRIANDAADLKVDHDNLNELLADKSRENKYLHQELSRISGVLSNKLLEIEEIKSLVSELRQQLKNYQVERDRLAVLLTEAEKAAALSRQALENQAKNTTNNNWTRIFKGK
jgi:predicted nuclease with TOPRIM domain